MDIPYFQEYSHSLEMENIDKENRREKIIEYFSTHQNIDDNMIHKFAEECGVSHDILEKEIYSILGSFLYYGEFRKNPLIEVNEKELSMGIEVEMEHTNCPMLAKRIALDHLAELPDYYTRLEKMEKEGLNDLKTNK